MSRRIVVVGPDAPLAAAVVILSLQAEGLEVSAAYLGPAKPGCDFVTSDGRFLPNDAFWLEWASGRALATNPGADPGGSANLVLAASDSEQVPAGRFEIVRADTVNIPADEFGRPRRTTASRAAHDRPCKIGLLGNPLYLGRGYPAVLARLGDAAERVDAAVRPVLVPADGDRVSEALDDLDGIVLPGGSDMAQVDQQIRVAATALARGLPTLGLCLGMQSMLTAAIRSAIWPDAALEEIAGPGSHRSFVRMVSGSGTACHRVGECHFRPAPGTRLHAIIPRGAFIRMNHRYSFNRDIETGYLPDFAFHWSGRTLDAIESRIHPFFIGLQGHPELGCDPALMEIWASFVESAVTSCKVRSS